VNCAENSVQLLQD